jgi:uncharacterized protein
VDLRENTYIGALQMRTASGREITLDARPSDAIALALRVGAPIWVAETVLEKSQGAKTAGPLSRATAKEHARWQEILQNLPSEAFGKYKM